MKNDEKWKEKREGNRIWIILKYLIWGNKWKVYKITLITCIEGATKRLAIIAERIDIEG